MRDRESRRRLLTVKCSNGGANGERRHVVDLSTLTTRLPIQFNKRSIGVSDKKIRQRHVTTPFMLACPITAVISSFDPFERRSASVASSLMERLRVAATSNPTAAYAQDHKQRDNHEHLLRVSP